MSASIEARVKQVICKQLGVSAKDITPDVSFVNDLGADSLDLVELAMALEEECHVNILDEDAEKIRTIKDMIEYIETRQL